MALPGNGIFVVRGEMSTLMTAMRRGARWSSTSYQDEEQDGLMKQFIELKQILNQIEDLKLIDPNVFLGPFLEVIRTEETTGAVTSLALCAVNKFLSYGLIDPTHPTLAVTVESIADAVTHARFMGTDQASDGVTLMRVVEVLHTLMRSPEGSALTNESVCEVMLSCFKICFEPRLNELLRRTAEQALKDMVLLLFMRLPQFSDERNTSGLIRKFKMMAGSMEQISKKKKTKSAQKQNNVTKPNVPRINYIKGEDNKSSSSNSANSVAGVDPQSPSLGVQQQQQQQQQQSQLKAPPLATTPATPVGNIVDMQGKITQTPTTALADAEGGNENVVNSEVVDGGSEKPLMKREDSVENDADVEDELVVDCKDEKKSNDDGEYINSVGVRFTQQKSVEGDGTNPLLPYGLPCIQELFRFLILLCNPLDKQNTDTMMHMGLSLLTVAFEVAADNIGKYDTLLALVKDEMCRNLFSLMNSERLTIFAADLQVCFLLFESLRSHLKFQLEFYLTKLSEIIASENPRTPYEMRELALDNLLQLWRIPGFVAELYVNYDCDLYCSDLFEKLTKLLSKNTLSATSAIYSTHVLSMDTLVSVIENIERNCIAAKSGNLSLQNTTRHSRNNSSIDAITIETDLNASGNESSGVENITTFMHKLKDKKLNTNVQKISKDKLVDLKSKKQILAQGTELFNQRPDKGIQFLQENGILNSILDPMEIAIFLRENPGLDKKMIGEYISKKKNVESKILENFVKSFDFANTRIDQALRLYLETFRLPGEAPLIFLVMEHFAEHWHTCNNEPFANTDAAFRLAYAIIMLNMDQHNHNAKRLNVPMTPEDFVKNLRGLNGNKDFDQDMLSNIFNAIKNEEIVMPAEQTGIVRENYLWKVLLRRGVGKDGVFYHVYDSSYDKELFSMIWGPSLAALSYMFDKSNENGYQKTLMGFKKCAGISAFYNLHEDFDALILTLCKFTTLLSIQQDANEITVAVTFGLNQKAQSAMKAVFGLVHDYGDCLRESWKNILEVIVQLFRLKLLPKSLMEVEDFCEPNGKATLILEKPSQKPEAGLFSSLYSYLSSEGQREPTYEEQEIIKIAKKCIKECQIDQIISESKFIQFESLQELLKCFLNTLKAPNAHKSVGLIYSEDVVVFLMEILIRMVVQNRDRMISLWSSCRDQMYLLLMGGASCGYDYLLNRTTVALLKLAIYLMRNEELCPVVLQSLKMLLMLKPNVLYRIAKQISIGMYELLKTSAQNIHTEADWQIIFTLLECVGAGAIPPDFEDGGLPPVGTKSDGALSSEEDSGLPDRGYISDSEVVNAKSVTNSPSSTPFSPSGENWILVNKDSELSINSRPQSPIGSSLIYPCKLLDHLPFSLFKCWDSLAFIVRNVAHITPYNFESCVRCIRTFVEACLDGGIKMRRQLATGKVHRKKTQRKDATRNRRRDDNSSESEDEELSQRYETLAIQLLDLMYTLYTRTAQIFRWWAEEGCAVPQCSALWAQGWCPLLQGIARLAMDRRREVRTYAISCLQQRALLVHDLQTLSGSEWASCFKQVLFPLLNELLPDSPSIVHIDQVLLEESRIRTATIMSKVFLHHLTPLIEMPSFNELWLEILDYIEKFMKVGSDMLYEQMLEILKNMLLVMHSVRIFHYNDGTTHSPLWDLTWKRIGEFLPNLKDELFKEEINLSHMAVMNQMSMPVPMDNMTATSQNVRTIGTAMISNDINLQGTPRKMEISETIVSSTSTKGSIILQPPLDILQGKTVILGQDISAIQQNVPILIPQAKLITPQQFSSSNINTINTSPLSSSPQSVLVPHQQSSTFCPNKIETSLPDLVNDASKVIENSKGYIPTPDTTPRKECGSLSGNVYQIRSNTEFSNVIELPDTPPPPSFLQNVEDQSLLANTSQASETELQHNYQQINADIIGIQYQQSFMQQQNLEQQQENEFQIQNLSPRSYEEFQQQQHQHQQQQQEQHQQQQQQQQQQDQQQDQQHQQQQKYLEQQQQEEHQNSLENYQFPPSVIDKSLESTNESKIKVPISHLLAGNQYPSLSKIPPPSIVQSFAPLYVQAQIPQSGTDIYSDYVQNPYNLTLQQSSTVIPSVEAGHIENPPIEVDNTSNVEESTKTQVLGVSNVFQSANYFGGVDQSTIPPGSELLFGQP